MNTTQPLNKILFLLDDISACKQRLSLATDVTRDIEIAVLQSKTVELFAEIQQYNRQALQPSNTQVPVNYSTTSPLKEAYTAPKQETISQPKSEPVAEKPTPSVTKPEPVASAPKLTMETTQTSDKQPKPIHPQSNPTMQERATIREEQIQSQPSRRETDDFEKKRERLLRDDANKISEPVVNQDNSQSQVSESRQTDPIRKETATQKPIDQKPEPVRQETPQPQPENQRTEPISQPQQQPETQKQSISQNYEQGKERVSNTLGSSLNERLAAQQQQTSLNDKFQSNVKKNLADKLKLSPISDLRTAININQRVAFINQLFKGDDKEFKNVVGTVNGFKNFSEAKFFLQSEIAPRYSWNEEEPAVQEFMELVYRKFL